MRPKQGNALEAIMLFVVLFLFALPIILAAR